MISDNSRYSGLPLRIHQTDDGERLPHLARRFMPLQDGQAVAGRHTVEPKDRIDLMAHAAYADPTQFWRLADFAHVVDPLELEIPGRTIDVPLAGPAFRPLPDEEGNS